MSPHSTAPTTFHEVPTLPLSAARDPDKKPEFLRNLRDALLNVGFLYLSDLGLPEGLTDDVVREAHTFFDLPMEEKERIEMKNARSFLGWSRLDNEITAHHIDHREQLDLSTPHPVPGPEAPLYHNLLAPNQWPDPKYLPRFREVYETYMRHMGDISMLFTSLIAEALGLPADAFSKFFDKAQQHKLKIVKYPPVGPEVQAEDIKARQGVGPHKDSMLSSYLLQASNQRGLQAQNHDGDWIDVPPVPGTWWWR